MDSWLAVALTLLVFADSLAYYGPTGDIQLWFRKSQTRFQSYAGQRYAEAV